MIKILFLTFMILFIMILSTSIVIGDDQLNRLDYYANNLQINQSLVVYDTAGVAFKGRFIKLNQSDNSILLGQKINSLPDKMSIDLNQIDSINVRQNSFAKPLFSILGLAFGGFVGDIFASNDRESRFHYKDRFFLKSLIVGGAAIIGLILGNIAGDAMGYDVMLVYQNESSP